MKGTRKKLLTLPITNFRKNLRKNNVAFDLILRCFLHQNSLLKKKKKEEKERKRILTFFEPDKVTFVPSLMKSNLYKR